ncbi:MAG TPA: lytic transglycosylase domain-containing protein [Usitatibacter sp.]|nr:lytic transglycosylase domain-containing protein [Usitatibacter sp.]
MAKLIRGTRWAALAVAACVAAPAFADIYSFRDEHGVVHFTNIKGLDPRYRLVRKEGAVNPVSYTPTAPYTPTADELERYTAIIKTASQSYGVDSRLVHAVISAESNYNPNAVSRTGAKGIMQLMPDTARRYGVQNSMDPIENIHAGTKYLRDLLAMFKGRLDLALAAYNAGENAVIRNGGIPPYAETRSYVPRVLGYYREFQKKG